MPSETQQRLEQFVQKYFPADAGKVCLQPLAGDASARQYYRCVGSEGPSYILVAYPEPFEAASFPYREIYGLLCEIGIPVPKLLAIEESLGIVLQEDLGDMLLQERLQGTSPRQARLLMRTAVDYIVKIQLAGSAALDAGFSAYNAALDEEKLGWELHFFRKNYLGRFSQAKLEDERSLFEEFDRLVKELAALPRVLCHRDFHVRNIMLRGGILYVIDFQDARWGPFAYDLASLLKDSVDLDAATVDELREYYLQQIRNRRSCEAAGEINSNEAFERHFHLACIQRLLKALGTYGFQAAVRNKQVYVQYMRGTLERALVSLLAVPEFPRIERLVTQELDRLKLRQPF